MRTRICWYLLRSMKYGEVHLLESIELYTAYEKGRLLVLVLLYDEEYLLVLVVHFDEYLLVPVVLYDK
jgi:hypothetical protein